MTSLGLGFFPRRTKDIWEGGPGVKGATESVVERLARSMNLLGDGSGIVWGGEGAQELSPNLQAMTILLHSAPLRISIVGPADEQAPTRAPVIPRANFQLHHGSPS